MGVTAVSLSNTLSPVALQPTKEAELHFPQRCLLTNALCMSKFHIGGGSMLLSSL